MSGKTRTNRGKATKAPDPAAEARKAAVQRVQVAVGYGIVAVAVVAGFLMSFQPRLFGLETSNPAVGFALAALAGFRLYVLRRELHRQTAEAPAGASASTLTRRRT